MISRKLTADFKDGAGISLLISLSRGLVLISLSKLNKLTGFLNRLNIKDRISLIAVG
jgi:hypothetical protein